MVYVRIIRCLTKEANKYRDICSSAKNDKNYVMNGNKQTDYGVTTALFKRHRFIVISEEDFENRKGFAL
ncbi:hypothetical protein COE42_21865 [Bacillus cereus]|nr:hypothetical protein CN347_27675 [Bacillus cereus]PFJ72348.1 hypothetical protein COJ08_28650 [Bacillus cereus]PFO65377.1 hypothetical protein COJ83_19430 [Bacillus cereus]PFO89291.1 hypothetical protein COJ89_16775 [Bacillus cereus]PFP21408.1 hypothetical protein COJ94_26855 [Bacillus cereus]